MRHILLSLTLSAQKEQQAALCRGGGHAPNMQALDGVDGGDHEPVILAHRYGSGERLSGERAEVRQVALVQRAEHQLAVVLVHHCGAVEGRKHVGRAVHAERGQHHRLHPQRQHLLALQGVVLSHLHAAQQHLSKADKYTPSKFVDIGMQYMIVL